MMSKTVRLSIAVIVSAGFFMSLDPDAAAFREKRDGVDLLVVPVKYSPLQVAFDTIAKRDLVLVGYKRDSNNVEVVLHVWNGLEWIEISEEQFESSAYLRAAPERIVLIGDDSSLPPMLVEAAKANPRAEVLQIPHTETASLLGSLGKVYDFNSREWKWFAARYRLELSDRNAELRQISFYDQEIVGRPEWPPWSKSRKTASTDSSVTVEEADVLPEASAIVPADVVMEGGGPDQTQSLSSIPPEWEERAVAQDPPTGQ